MASAPSSSAADAPGAPLLESCAVQPWVHKDFHLRHADPRLHCEEFCWGNMEAAHPILGRRSQSEVDDYRTRRGLTVRSFRGRDPPKPFQVFPEVASSFPPFVKAVFYELFSERAEPTPVQAQAWPCLLSGMDLLAVSPTGTGKTLAYLLPAMVHILAQPEPQPGDGPVALVLVPTQELAQQTLQVAERFFSLTEGQGKLHVGLACGGMDASAQVPAGDGPRQGCWPDLLVATPGRLLTLTGDMQYPRNPAGLQQANDIQPLLSLRRTSFVVIDEADLQLEHEPWLIKIHKALRGAHPCRQTALMSATWSDKLQPEADKLCQGADFMRLCLTPDVPTVPQELLLLPGDSGSPEARRAWLTEWLGSGRRELESVLVLCMNSTTVGELLACAEFKAAAGSAEALAEDTALCEHRWAAYSRFAKGTTDVLVTTFALGARGLDYADTVAAADSATRISIAVVLFDFPRHVTEYIHCIGRACRPGQLQGRVVGLMPEIRFWLGRELVDLLHRSGQQPAPELERLVQEDARFLQEIDAGLARLKLCQFPWKDDDAGSPPWPFEGSDYNVFTGAWSMPGEWPSYRRRLIHALAGDLDVPHVSTGVPPARRLHLAVRRDVLPDKFFLVGELVEVEPQQRQTGPPDRRSPGLTTRRQARVVDPKIHPKFHSIRVRYLDNLDGGSVAVNAKTVHLVT